LIFDIFGRGSAPDTAGSGELTGKREVRSLLLRGMSVRRAGDVKGEMEEGRKKGREESGRKERRDEEVVCPSS